MGLVERDLDFEALGGVARELTRHASVYDFHIEAGDHAFEQLLKERRVAFAHTAEQCRRRRTNCQDLYLLVLQKRPGAVGKCHRAGVALATLLGKRRKVRLTLAGRGLLAPSGTRRRHGEQQRYDCRGRVRQSPARCLHSDTQAVSQSKAMPTRTNTVSTPKEPE